MCAMLRHQSVVVAVPDAADRGLDRGLSKAFGVLDRHVLRPAITMTNQATAMSRSAVVERSPQRFQRLYDVSRPSREKQATARSDRTQAPSRCEDGTTGAAGARSEQASSSTREGTPGIPDAVPGAKSNGCMYDAGPRGCLLLGRFGLEFEPDADPQSPPTRTCRSRQVRAATRGSSWRRLPE